MITELHLEQPAALTALLQELLSKDTYNKFCVDCNRNESTHTSVTYGTFICQDCASIHLAVLGMDKSYVKPIFGEPWDNHQVRMVQLGGNKKLWDFLKQYAGLEQKGVSQKYESAAARFYRKKLNAEATGRPFSEKEPPKNAEEYLDRGVEGAKSVAKSAGEGIVKGVNILGNKIEESGIKDKLKGFFAKKTSQGGTQ
jgi:ADP-ribosylation factor GTPase-activating protein 1